MVVTFCDRCKEVAAVDIQPRGHWMFEEDKEVWTLCKKCREEVEEFLVKGEKVVDKVEYVIPEEVEDNDTTDEQ